MSSNVIEKPKRILVVPGEVISRDPKHIPGRGAYRDGKEIISVFTGLLNIHGRYVNVTPLNGIYFPEIGDKVIGLVVDKTPTKWIVDINSNSLALLSPKDAIGKDEESQYKRQRVGTYSMERVNKLDKYEVGDWIIRDKDNTAFTHISANLYTRIMEATGKMIDRLSSRLNATRRSLVESVDRQQVAYNTKYDNTINELRAEITTLRNRVTTLENS